MKRRQFISSITAQTFALAVVPPLWAMGENNLNENYGVSPTEKKTVTRIGKWSLEDIRDIFKREFEDKIMPIWNEEERPILDRKYGGYLFHSNPTRRPIPEDAKALYYQGRILWLYSYFYNHFGRDPFHLEAAKCGYDFLTKYAR